MNCVVNTESGGLQQRLIKNYGMLLILKKNSVTYQHFNGVIEIFSYYLNTFILPRKALHKSFFL